MRNLRGQGTEWTGVVEVVHLHGEIAGSDNARKVPPKLHKSPSVVYSDNAKPNGGHGRVSSGARSKPICCIPLLIASTS
jgi:hypothetical protein